MGQAGLAYDLAALRAQTPKTMRERLQLRADIKRLEGIAARYTKLNQLLAADTSKKQTAGTLPCWYRDPWTGRSTYYNAYAQVNATTEYYMDNGGGGLNPYYARASATASGTVFRPYGVPSFSGTVSVYAVAKNVYTNQTVTRSSYGTSVGVGTGYVYSGPEFSHNLTATASVYGSGDCFGYISISDALQ